MKIYFIGIGGIGVSALAQYYFQKGNEVLGSDLTSSEITDFLKKQGIKIKIGKHKAGNLPSDVDMVIYSPAVQKENPELKKAIQLRKTHKKLKIKSYPEALGDLTKEYFTIAVSGTHGKSTTCAMISLILIKAGLDPTVIIGTKLKEFGDTNFRKGKGKYLLIEADEWRASFLNYWPKIIVLTNIEREHLDYYKNLRAILKTFKSYINHLPSGGFLVANKNDKNIRKIIPKKPKFKIVWCSFREKEIKKIKEIIKIPGKHNLFNAFFAFKTAKVLGISEKVILSSLSKYKGAWRRFEVKNIPYGNGKIKIISDYGHHPTEVMATLTTAREAFSRKRIICIFQPHQYQRTFYLFRDFVKVFKKALSGRKPLLDKLIITDIYDVAGREKGRLKKEISSEKVVKKVNSENALYLPLAKVKQYLKKILKKGDVLLIMGAGDIYKLANTFPQELLTPKKEG